MKRKGELSINIIIVAAIALLVLVIIAALLIKQSSKVEKVVSKCGGGIGHCDVSCNTNEQEVPDPTCNNGQVCCIPLTTS